MSIKPRPPVCGVMTNPLIGMRPTDMREVAVGVPIGSLAPPVTRGLLFVRVNGEWLSRESWGSLTRYGDVIEWYDLPQDRDSLRLSLIHI